MGRNTAVTFLTERFRRLAPGETVEIRPIGQGGVGPRRWFADPARAAAYALTLAAQWQVYYGVCPRRAGGGSKADVTSVHGLWADVDDNRFPTGRAGALAALAGFPLAPNWLVDSGGGLHAYWDLAVEITLAQEASLSRDRTAGVLRPVATVERVEGVLRRLYVRLGGLDAVQDLSRIFRVPGTLNHKQHPPRPVRLLAHNAASYTLAEIEQLLPAPPPPAPRAPIPYVPSADWSGASPSQAEVASMLEYIPPRGEYTEDWLRVLAAVHSVHPGPEGVALCEAWSPGRPGEIEAKFSSFGHYSGTPASVGTLVHLAKQQGWQPRTKPVAMPVTPRGHLLALAAGALGE